MLKYYVRFCSKSTKMNKILYALDYVYRDITSTSKDILTEMRLFFIKRNKNQNKKILAYWDFNQRMSKLGDFITYLEYLNILAYEAHVLSYIEFTPK